MLHSALCQAKTETLLVRLRGRACQFNEGSGYVDAISIDAWAKGMTASIFFVQEFRPFASGKFELLGDPLAVIDGEVQNPSASSVIYLQSLPSSLILKPLNIGLCGL